MTKTETYLERIQTFLADDWTGRAYELTGYDIETGTFTGAFDEAGLRRYLEENLAPITFYDDTADLEAFNRAVSIEIRSLHRFISSQLA